MRMDRRPVLFLFAMTAFCFSGFGEDQNNLFNAKAGARIVAFSSNYAGGWDVTNLIGDDEGEGGSLPVWCTEQNAPFPHWVVIELPKRSWITTLIFNNFIPDEAGGWEGISAKHVEVHLSSESATEGFKRWRVFSWRGTRTIRSSAWSQRRVGGRRLLSPPTGAIRNTRS